MIPLSCAFDRAILNRTCGCSCAVRKKQETQRSVRRTVECGLEQGQQDCMRLLSHMREGANFVFQKRHKPGALSNTQAVRFQCGGLIGLQQSLDKMSQSRTVEDIYRLMQRCLRRYGRVEDFPLQEIVRGIASQRK